MRTPVAADLDVVETLDEVARLHAIRIEAESRIFELAAHFADLHPAESLLPQTAPGGERAVQIGGAGTPRMTEFAYAELGARMQMSTWSARRLVADTLDVRHRLPRTWERVQRREARVGSVRLVATRTRHLSAEAASYVDKAMVDFVDGSLPWGRFEARLDGVVVKSDPTVAAEREQERAAEQIAKRTRSSDAGTAGFYVRSTVGVIARIDATVAYVAEALLAFGDTDVEDVRRVKAVLVLANPQVAVELLAAYQAKRSTTADVELPVEGEQSADESAVALTRMDAFARRVVFTPTRGLDQFDRPTFRFDWSRLLPPLTLHLHLAAADLGSESGGVVRWEGEGPVTHQFVHDQLRPLHRYTIQPVIDLAGQVPADAYEVSDRHRRAVRLRSPADYFPFTSNLDPRVDVDHVLPHALGGKSRLENYGPLGRFHHRLKTHGRWTVRQPFPGVYLWRDPHGVLYLVDHTGTRAVPRTG